MKTLEKEFHEKMMDVHRRAKNECSYNAKAFHQMLSRYGGLETAHRLLRGKTPQYGFAQLWECGCLHITVECLVLDARYREFFEESELGVARKRLQDHGFDPRRCERCDSKE